MPGLNIVKIYRPNSFYHIYNRGNEKQKIFHGDKDYEKFITILQKAVESSEVRLHCYCLMPNHFHLLVSQKNSHAIIKLMRILLSTYVGFFNIKYTRVGHLFQGTYRARIIKDERDLLQTSAYIHNNPRKHKPRLDLKKYRYSSYLSYVKGVKNDWIDKKVITAHFLIDDYNKYLGENMNSTEELA